MLLCRAATALLVVREPQADPQRCLANLLLPIAPYETTTVQAAGWSLKLMRQNGLLRVLAIAEPARAPLDQEVQERNIIEMDTEKFQACIVRSSPVWSRRCSAVPPKPGSAAD